MNYNDWTNEAHKLSNAELTARIEALTALRAWPAFYRAFQGLRTFDVLHVLEHERMQRRMEVARG